MAINAVVLCLDESTVESVYDCLDEKIGVARVQNVHEMSNQTARVMMLSNTVSIEKIEALFHSEPSELQQALDEKEEIIADLKHKLEMLEDRFSCSVKTLQKFRVGQEELMEKFEFLKSKYKEISTINRHLLWEYLPSKLDKYAEIPPISNAVIEKDDRIGPYLVHSVLGEGQWAKVYSCTHEDDKYGCSTSLAIKAIQKRRLFDLNGVRQVKMELRALFNPKLQHKGLLSALDTMHTDQCLYIVAENGGQDLFYYTEKYPVGVPDQSIKIIMRNVAESLDHLHRNNYCHRDLKPENVILNAETLDTILIDFGLCEETKPHKVKGICGSPGFFAPEMLGSDGYDGEKVDVWSFGCILLELLVGREVFQTNWMNGYKQAYMTTVQTFSNKLHQNFEKLKETELKNYSKDIVSVLKMALQVDPEKRCNMTDILTSHWYGAEAKKKRFSRSEVEKTARNIVSSAKRSMERKNSSQRQFSSLPSVFSTSQD